MCVYTKAQPRAVAMITQILTAGHVNDGQQKCSPYSFRMFKLSFLILISSFFQTQWRPFLPGLKYEVIDSAYISMYTGKHQSCFIYSVIFNVFLFSCRIPRANLNWSNTALIDITKWWCASPLKFSIPIWFFVTFYWTPADHFQSTVCLVEPKDHRNLTNARFFFRGASNGRDVDSSYSKCLTSVAPRIAVCHRDSTLLRRENANCTGNNVWSCPFGQSCSGWWVYAILFKTSCEREDGALTLYEVTSWIKAFDILSSISLQSSWMSTSPFLSCYCPRTVFWISIIRVWQSTECVGFFFLSIQFAVMCSAVVALHNFILLFRVTQWHCAQTVTWQPSLQQLWVHHRKHCTSAQSLTSPTSDPEVYFSSAWFSCTLWQWKPTAHYIWRRNRTPLARMTLNRKLFRLQKWCHMETVAALLIYVGGHDSQSLWQSLIVTGYSLKNKPLKCSVHQIYIVHKKKAFCT